LGTIVSTFLAESTFIRSNIVSMPRKESTLEVTDQFTRLFFDEQGGK